MPIPTQWVKVYPNAEEHWTFVSIKVPELSTGYNDLLRAGDVLELMETQKPVGKDPKTGKALKDPGGWSAAVMEPTAANHPGSHLLLVQRTIDKVLTRQRLG